MKSPDARMTREARLRWAKLHGSTQRCPSTRRSGIVRRSQIGELDKQIDVGLYLVRCHLPVCEDCEESVAGIVGERPAIARKGRRTRRVVGQHIGQDRARRPLLLLRCIPARVLQRVREDGNEVVIIRRFTCHVSRFENETRCGSGRSTASARPGFGLR
jgi:hypothetical protein